MIIGAEYADRDIYSQENNPIDVYNKKANSNNGYLESCGPSAMLNCCSAISKNEIVVNHNGLSIQPEQIVFDVMNDPNNYEKLLPYRNNISLEDLQTWAIPSRIPQYFPWASMILLDIKSVFSWNDAYEHFDIIKEKILKKHAVQIQFKNPGHYVAITKFDTEKNHFLYHDSWFSRWNDNNGRDRILTKDEFNYNIHTFNIDYIPKNQE